MKRFHRLLLPSFMLALLSFALILFLNQGIPLGAEAAIAQTPSPTSIKPVNASPNASPSPASSNPDKNVVEISMTVLGFDPVKGEVEARLEFMPKGKYAIPDNDYAAQNLLLTTNNVDKQGSEIIFRADRYMDAAVVRFTTTEGDVNDYPFDSYQSEMTLSLEEFTGSNDPVEATEFQAVPIEFTSIASIPGFEISVSPVEKANTKEFVYMSIDIERSATVQFFSLVVMLIMWVLSILALLLAIRVLRAGKMPETAMLGLMAALLFAFPAIRNAQPNVPPIGTLSDFLSFLWTEALVVVALLILGSCWLRRYHPVEKQEKPL